MRLVFFFFVRRSPHDLDRGAYTICSLNALFSLYSPRRMKLSICERNCFRPLTLKSKRRTLKGTHSRVLSTRPPSSRGVSFEFCRHDDLKRMPSERVENETRYRWTRGRPYSTRSVVFFHVTSPSGDYCNDSRHEPSESPGPLMCPQSPPGGRTHLYSFPLHLVGLNPASCVWMVALNLLRNSNGSNVTS